jgi:hypothetical protein
VSFRENGMARSVYRDVNSGGSFGSNPLRQHIGIGTATIIDSIQIKWPATGKTQVFKNIQVNTNFRIEEGNQKLTTYSLAIADFASTKSGLISCSPSGQ